MEIIQLRLLSLALGDFNQEEFVDLLGKVILAADYFPLSDLEKVQNTIVSAEVYWPIWDIRYITWYCKRTKWYYDKRRDFQDNILFMPKLEGCFICRR